MAMTAGDAVAGRTQTALVTGGTGGMGRAIAAQLAADGFDVAVAYAGEIDLADATVGEIKGHGRRGEAFAADIADAWALQLHMGHMARSDDPMLT
jgi:3-oxoacyl-[acyl-carrier protein] reductase